MKSWSSEVVFLFVLMDVILLKLDLQKRTWTILQIKSCLSNKNASYIQKLGTCFLFSIQSRYRTVCSELTGITDSPQYMTGTFVYIK